MSRHSPSCHRLAVGPRSRLCHIPLAFNVPLVVLDLKQELLISRPLPGYIERLSLAVQLSGLPFVRKFILALWKGSYQRDHHCEKYSSELVLISFFQGVGFFLTVRPEEKVVLVSQMKDLFHFPVREILK